MYIVLLFIAGVLSNIARFKYLSVSRRINFHLQGG